MRRVRETRRAERARLGWCCVAPSQQRLRRSSRPVSAALQPSTQMAVSSSRPSWRCCWQHLEERRGSTSRRDASCAQHQLRRSSIAPSQQQQQAMAVSRDDERSTGLFFLYYSAFTRNGTTLPPQANKQMRELGVTHPVRERKMFSFNRASACGISDPENTS